MQNNNQQKEIRVQILEENNFNDGKLYKLKQNCSLYLQLSNKLIHENVRVFCNMPKNSEKFERSKYYEYEWESLPDSLRNDEFNKFISIECRTAGAYNYYFTLNNQTNKESSKGGSNFLVDPHLTFHNGQHVDLNSLQLQTVLVKLLGPLDEWKSRLVSAKESNYNMIHFTPIQELSTESNSSYCIRNHFKLNAIANNNGKYEIDYVEQVIDSFYKEWNMFSISDLVYNHMANDSEFLQKCPEATYNLSNSPHLIPSFVLDRILYHITVDITNGTYESQGISSQKLEEYNVETIRHIIRHQEIPKYKLDEFFIIDLNKVLNNIKEIGLSELEKIEKNLEELKKLPRVYSSDEQRENEWRKLKINQDPQYKRLGSYVDSDVIYSILKVEFEKLNLDLDLKNSNENSQLLVNIYERFWHELNKSNEAIRHQIEGYLTEAANNVIANLYYQFFAHDGPKWRKVTKKQPIVYTYFYFPFEDANVRSDELLAFDKNASIRIQAHNGWVMNDDPLKNFAGKGTTVYFRRHLLPWGDSVKLRYGDGPQDNPELWNFMAEYTKTTARIFHGVRLDNCHSTPVHVAQYFLDLARSVRPNLYVIAELFTNSVHVDHKFVSELGITSLIREGMGAWNANELGRLVHRFGGEPAGSFFQHPFRPLTESLVHATFYDQTHDNQSLIHVHSYYDALPNSALVLMSGCATGSSRGYDELVPHHINVVTEDRLYSVWDPTNKTPNSISEKNGIIKAKAVLNKLHFEMGFKGFSQLYVDQFDADTTVVTRHNPVTHESIILIARTSFCWPNDHTFNALSKPLTIPSKIESILFEANLIHAHNAADFKQSDSFLNGLTNYSLELKENLNVDESKFIDRIDYDGNVSYVHFKYFPPGTVAAFKVTLNEISQDNLTYLRESIFELMNSSTNATRNNEIGNIISNLTLDELNILLFRCSSEELGEQIDSDVYTIPNYGPLVYAGLQGFVSVLEKQRLSNNLGHPIFENLRNGNWMLDYIVARLIKYYELEIKNRQSLFLLSKWLDNVFGALSKLPRYLIPAYFDLIITGLFTKALDRCWSLISSSNLKNKHLEKFDIVNGSSFVRSLALGSVILDGHLRTAALPNTIVAEDDNLMLSLSAGLPFFSVSLFRNWGRDTFISLRGLLLLTNRFRDAKNLILSYGSCLRHGLIPNLLGEGKCARYNCRDSVWWWLKAIKDYTELAPNGNDILNSLLIRLYPTDDSTYPSELSNKSTATGLTKQKLFDVIQEALTVHVKGLKFRERNAGRAIDEHMLSEGFNIEIGVNHETGFVFGGNAFNCGTWMDKLGSSDRAGNRGLPATPRDGSAIELIGLSRCVLDWLIKTNSDSSYPYDGVVLESGKKFTWVEWAQKIDNNFEKYYWIDENSNESQHINQRNIYKDTLNSSIPWTDYQFRPNYLLAITLAPQMVNKEHAKKALNQCRLNLVNEPNTVGIKTLDSSDYNYFGIYDNSNNSYDKRVANGFNYHQGPEWLWPVGYYLRAQLLYSKDDENLRADALKLVKKHLGKLNERFNANDWKGLPELTNRNGEECHFSCPVQAWSFATTLEVFFDLAIYE